MGGHLARIESQQEQDFVFQLVRGVDSRGVWIDGSDAINEGDWRYSNGEQMTFGFWATNSTSGAREPRNFNDFEHSVAMITEKGFIAHQKIFTVGMWGDYPADKRFFYVCEWDE